ncbi:MAG: alpha-amylase family glycosyl hydrolase [Eubacteriales bacterium]|nr:alpha-amylase family glycosyl hydrolase [Eubacteriales bacterium]
MAASRKTKKSSYKILEIDPYLAPFHEDIELRMQRYTDVRKALFGEEADVAAMANGYLYFGFHRTETGWVYREWAPAADALHLVGDFNSWNKTSHPMKPLKDGVWEIELPGRDALKHGQYVGVMVTCGGQRMQRVPAYIRWTGQNPVTYQLTGRICASAPYRWQSEGFLRRKMNPLFIYEAHIGMAQDKEGIGTYREFADNILPRIKKQGYNAVQIMALAEHPYYASFGYQVSSFFAPSYRFGEPDDLKYLIDTAHGMGIMVLMDLVHSHSCANEGESLYRFDGSEGQYFHTGPSGVHPAWRTRLFNYGKHEVIHYLLSNIKYWMEEFHIDGFRFDGVTSMLYHDHGLGRAFVGYESYFSMNTDVEAVTYLQLATELIHAVNPFAVAIAEDMSGMPGMCIPIRYGGIGFDYRLGMGVPDLWIKLIKDYPDESWDIGMLWYELTTCRPKEKVVGYCESHDQAMVGDKTIIFRLADAQMYTGMNKDYHSIVIDRAIALCNIIRLLTISLAGEGWLNFMGNEFGHPEWIDFPREGNGWSYGYARRQWSLADNPMLKYEWLANFDREMLKVVKKHRVLADRNAIKLWDDQNAKLLVYAKGDTIFAFNLHPSLSQTDFFIPVGQLGEGDWELALDTDRPEFGGQGRIAPGQTFVPLREKGKGKGIKVYLPARTGIVLRRKKA